MSGGGVMRRGAGIVPIGVVLFVAATIAFTARPGAAAQEATGIDVAVLAEVSSRRVFVGERLTLTYRLVRGAHPAGERGAVGMDQETGDAESDPAPEAPPLMTPVRNVRIEREPRFEYFWANEVKVDDDEMRRRPESIPLRRFHLYPLTPGRLEVAPAAFGMQAYPLDLDGMREASVEIVRETASIAIETAPLPASGRPETFGGAVGTFALAIAETDLTTSAGQVVRIRVDVRGDGNLEMTGPPRLAPSEALEVLSARRVSVDLGLDDPRGIGRATWHLDIVPREEGRFEPGPVLLDYFDPAGGRYQVARSEPLSIAVTPAPPAAPAAAPLPLERSWGVAGWLLGGALAAAFAGALTWAAVRRSRRRRSGHTMQPADGAPEPSERVDPGRLRARIRQAMVQAEAARRAGDARAMHARLLGGLRELLEHQYGLDLEGACKLEERLVEVGVDRALAVRVRELYDWCQQASYAPLTIEAETATIEEAAHVFKALIR